MKWYFYFLLLCPILAGVSPIADAAQVIRGPTDTARQFTVESLPECVIEVACRTLSAGITKSS
jgi:hypothetical protein